MALFAKRTHPLDQRIGKGGDLAGQGKGSGWVESRAIAALLIMLNWIQRPLPRTMIRVL
jgi:hypothetical protein